MLQESVMLCQDNQGCLPNSRDFGGRYPVVYIAVDYVFMFECSFGHNNFYLFLQKCVLHVKDKTRLPTAILIFFEKLGGKKI